MDLVYGDTSTFIRQGEEIAKGLSKGLDTNSPVKTFLTQLHVNKRVKLT